MPIIRSGFGIPFNRGLRILGAAHIAHAVRRLLLFLLAAVARHPAFAARFTRFFARPLVRRSLLVRGLAALARNVALFAPIHRRKSAIFLCHVILLAAQRVQTLGCNWDATRESSNY